MSGSPGSLRSTQRAPRSCIPCSNRKVKCDKAEPCATCVRRGEASACRRETVLIRGEPKTWVDSQPTPTLETLQLENQQLKNELQALKELQSQISESSPAPSSTEGYQLEKNDPIENALWDSLGSAAQTAPRSIKQWSQIYIPNRFISDQLVSYDRTWNSWVHYGVEYPRFQDDCDDFVGTIEKGLQLQEHDPFWMAVYFSVLCVALLMMDDAEAAALLVSQNIPLNVKDLCRNWYDAALFCLHQADFMRASNIGSVQAIAVLGMCFNLLGETDLCEHMWSIAIRVAQRLGLDTPSSQHVQGMSTEAQHRLWWTLVICEWLNVSYRSTQIDQVDFQVPLPVPSDITLPDGRLEIDAAHYHLFMARLATVYQGFRRDLQSRKMSLESSVKKADEALALVIDTLPDHLQPEPGAENTQDIDKSQPWIKWQRFDITLVLLHHRVRVNRILQRYWLASPGAYPWARAVCIQSSLHIIWISSNWDQPLSMRKQWALSLHLFVASAILITEWRSSENSEARRYKEAIESSINILEQVQSQNEIARHAIPILRRQFYISQRRQGDVASKLLPK